VVAAQLLQELMRKQVHESSCLFRRQVSQQSVELPPHIVERDPVARTLAKGFRDLRAQVFDVSPIVCLFIRGVQNSLSFVRAGGPGTGNDIQGRPNGNADKPTKEREC
jgi:hypothetical protein